MVTSNVAMSGAIIPAPLAMPAIVTVFPPTRTRRSATFGNASVVMIARAALPEAVVVERPHRRRDPAPHRLRRQHHPDLPGRARQDRRLRDPESVRDESARLARDLHAGRTGARVGVAAVDQHRLRPPAREPRRHELDRRRLDAIAGDDPAATAGTSDTINARSSFPDALMPQANARKQKPGNRDRPSRT